MTRCASGQAPTTVVRPSTAASVRSRSQHGAHEARRDGPCTPAAHRRLPEVFLSAAPTGDLSALEDALTADVVSHSDGNGIRGASRIPVIGRPHVPQYPVAFAPRFRPQAEIRWVEANGRSAVLVSSGGEAVALLTTDISADGVDRLMRVMNPDEPAPYVASLSG